MSKKIKVLHMLCSNRFSGAENVVCQIINMFHDDPNIEMAYASPDGQIREALKERNIKFYPMKGYSLSEYRRVIKEARPDIIHAHDMKAGVLTAATCGKIPLISHIHNNNFDSRKLTVKALLYRVAARKARHIFWVSKSSFKGYYFHKELRKKSSILYNVIDTKTLQEKAKSAQKQDGYDIIYLGRLTPQKNPQRLVTVLGNVVERKPDVQCAVIGTGELEEEVKALSHNKGLDSNVHFLGFMSNAYGILEHSKLMIMTSRWEGTPMCALEAMALGVPIVSTPTDGLKELVIDGKTGYLRDKNDELAEACVKILNDPVLRNNMSEKTLERSDKLMDLQHYHDEILKAYREVF